MEHVAQHGAQGFGFGGVQQHVSANDGHRRSSASSGPV
jgi:hypothetical protein